MQKVFQKIENHLNTNSVHFIQKTHEATLTSIDSARVRGESLANGAKAIVMKVEKDFHLFVLPANMRIDPKKIKQYFKAKGLKVKKTRFATNEELFDMTGLVSGSVPPFGFPILNFQLFLDPQLLENETISFNAGSLTNSITMRARDYEKVASAEVFSFATK